MKTEIISVCMFLFLHVCRTLMDAAMLEYIKHNIFIGHNDGI